MRLPTVDAHETNEKLSTQTKGHWRLSIVDDFIDIVLDVLLENVVLVQLLLAIGSQPDLGKRASLGQQGLRIEHGDRLCLCNTNDRCYDEVSKPVEGCASSVCDVVGRDGTSGRRQPPVGSWCGSGQDGSEMRSQQFPDATTTKSDAQRD